MTEEKFGAAKALRRIRTEAHACLPSTNDRIRTLALAGEAEGLLVIAEAQTAGRGRQGRSFFSPAGTGLYMSLLLRPQTLEAPERITAAAAVAAARLIGELSDEEAGIKWVNDIWLRGKKVAGILTEGGADAEGRLWVALGVGVNLLPPEGGFPEELQDIAAAVFPQQRAVSREEIARRFAEIFFELYDAQDRKALLDEYRARSVLTGKIVYITISEQERRAEVLGIGEDFALLVQTDTGERLALRSGEARVRPMR